MAKQLTLRKLRTLKVALDGPSFEWTLLEFPAGLQHVCPCYELTACGELEDLDHYVTNVAAQSEDTFGVPLDFPQAHFHALQCFPRTVDRVRWGLGNFCTQTKT